MKLFGRSHLRITLWYFAFWLVAINFLIFIRFMGHSTVATNPINPDIPVDFRLLLQIGFLASILFAISFGFLEAIFERRPFTRMNYGQLILTKSLIHTFLFSAALVLLSFRNQQISQGYIDFQQWKSSFSVLNLLVWTVYMGVASILVSFIKEVNLKFGPGNLWRMLIGKFHRPQQEEKILMFMDLRSSTAIAERLGHIKYSEMIQDCFSDLAIVREYQAEVYQYVGDETVLSWDVSRGIRDSNCIKAFFAYQDLLQKRSEYYLERYNLIPVFKAGMNLGLVTVAEVGRIKKEIAFHGDTMNVAARIQDMCNELNRELLISESLAKRLINNKGFKSEHLGKVPLKGKEEKVVLFAIHQL